MTRSQDATGLLSPSVGTAGADGTGPTPSAPPPAPPHPADAAPLTEAGNPAGDGHPAAHASGEGGGTGRRKKPATSKTIPGYHEAIAAFTDEFKAAFEVGAYPWCFAGRDSDAARVRTWVAAAAVTGTDPAPGIDRIRHAARAYCAAVKAGIAWPKGEPATTKHFTAGIARWLQINPAEPPKRTQLETWADLGRELESRLQHQEAANGK